MPNRLPPPAAARIALRARIASRLDTLRCGVALLGEWLAGCLWAILRGPMR